MQYPKLYKEKNGKVLWWSIETTKNKVNGSPMYMVSFGQVGGKTQAQTTDVLKGKNVGRANETTAEQQCELEAKSKWTKQKEREGYVEDISGKRTGAFVPVRPMLAHSYDEYPNKVVFPCYIQKKYDGICCLAHVDANGDVRFFSRKSTEFETLDHLKNGIKQLGLHNIVLHGELYNHDLKFEEISSGVKRDETNDKSSLMNYIVYDAVLSGNYESRLATLSYLLPPEWSKNSQIRLATTTIVNTIQQVDDLHEKFVADRYEGAILRNPQGLYAKDKRSHDLLKYKKFKEDEFPIVGANPSTKGKSVGTCVFVCKAPNGNEFEATPDGTHEYQQQLWSDWQSGKIKPGMIATVKYFCYTSTKNPVPKMCTFKAIRNYE